MNPLIDLKNNYKTFEKEDLLEFMTYSLAVLLFLHLDFVRYEH